MPKGAKRASYAPSCLNGRKAFKLDGKQYKYYYPDVLVTK